ncbi:MAG: hypothetical protein SFV23_05435 [Planctomycetaceae bacterium]|nr:hypothetical protein [Planctomycetaceae bacterium]
MTSWCDGMIRRTTQAGDGRSTVVQRNFTHPPVLEGMVEIS